MPIRVVLNVVYTLLVDGLDEKERTEFDNDLVTAGPGSWADLQEVALDRLDAIADAQESGEPSPTDAR